MSEKRNEHSPVPQKWAMPDKIVTLNTKDEVGAT
jgi:hypothetical protein